VVESEVAHVGTSSD